MSDLLKQTAFTHSMNQAARPTISYKIFDTNSSFHVKWPTTGKV